MDLLQHLDLPNLSDSSDTDDFLQELAALNDAGLLRATMESLECGRLTPLIKEELRCRIQSRRLSEGKEELLVEFPSPTPSQPRPDEVQKRDRRREQNRRAAQKFRKKKKERGEHLIEETQRLESHNTSLRSEIKQLHEEREQLTRIIRSHASVCPLTPRQSPLTIIRESPLPGSIRGSPLTLPLTSASLLARSPVMGKSPVHGKSPVMSKSPVVVQSPVLLVPPTRESPVPLLIINAARESPIPGRVVPSSPVPMSGRPRKSPVSMLRINQSPIPGDKLGHKSPILFGSPPKQSKHSIPPRLNLAGPKPVVPILPKPAANSSPSPKTPMGLIMSPLPLAPSPVSVGGRALHMSPVFFGDGCFTPSSRTRQVSQSPISVTDSSSNSTPARMTQQSPVFFGERAPSTAHSGPHFLQPLSASSTSSTSSLASLLRQESPLSVLSNSSGVSNVSSVFVGNSQNSNNNQLDNNTFMDNTSNNNNVVSNNNINNNNSSSCNNNNNNSINNIFDPPSHFQPKSPFACSPNPASREHPDDNVLCLEDIERSATGYEARDDLIDFIDIQALLELSGDQNGNNQGDHSRGQRDGNHGVNQARHNFVEHDMCQVEDSLMEPSSTHNTDVDQSLNQVDVSGNRNEMCRGEKTMSSPAFDRQIKSQGVTEIAQSLLAIAQNLPGIAQNSSTFGVKDNDPSKLNGPNTPGQQGSVFDMETSHVYRDLNSGKETNGGFYHCPYVGHQDSAFRGTSLDQVGLSLRDYAKFSHDSSILNPASLASLHSSLRELLAAQNARMAQEQIESHANTDTHDSSSSSIHVSTEQLGQQTAINNDNDLPDDSNRCLSNSGFSQIGSDEHACGNDNSDSDYANLQSSFSLDMLMTPHSICSTPSESRFSQVSHQYS